MSSTAVATLERVRLETPKRYKVLLLNNDVTPFDCVIALLMDVFNKPYDEALALSKDVHEKGQGVAGIYPREIAEQKQYESVEFATNFGHPELEVVLEQE